MLVAFATLAVAFVSSAYSGGANEVIREFRIGQEVFVLGTSLFVLGFAIGYVTGLFDPALSAERLTDGIDRCFGPLFPSYSDDRFCILLPTAL